MACTPYLYTFFNLREEGTFQDVEVMLLVAELKRFCFFFFLNKDYNLLHGYILDLFFKSKKYSFMLDKDTKKLEHFNFSPLPYTQHNCVTIRIHNSDLCIVTNSRLKKTDLFFRFFMT